MGTIAGSPSFVARVNMDLANVVTTNDRAVRPDRQRMKVLVAACGSRGDNQPMLALAATLRDAGHDVHFAGSPPIEGDAKACGVPFTAVGMDLFAYINENREQFTGLTPWRAVTVMMGLVGPELERQFKGLAPLARGCDLVVGGGAQMAGPSVAEAAGAPYRIAVYTPQALPSAHHMPFMIPLPSLGPLNRVAWAATRTLWRRVFGPAMNAQRAALGLAPVDDLVEHLFPTSNALLAYDPDLMPTPPDVRVENVALGAFHLADPRPLDASLEAFLASGPAPVYIGFGSMPDAAPEETAAIIASAIRDAKVRAIVSTGWAGLRGDFGPDVLLVGATNHGLLFPRCAAVVHHGGAGTTHAAARAGVPQLVVPHGFDQFEFARRVYALACAVAPVPRTKLDAKRLGEALRALASDGAMRAKARALGERMRTRQGATDAVGVLERELRTSRERQSLRR